MQPGKDRKDVPSPSVRPRKTWKGARAVSLLFCHWQGRIGTQAFIFEPGIHGDGGCPEAKIMASASIPILFPVEKMGKTTVSGPVLPQVYFLGGSSNEFKDSNNPWGSPFRCPHGEGS
ncbi:hypothetical protein B4135_4160 [Caldibacillus debilis]|uniref:Uncharacterized protein n=1 Tax=Caldibacillus debilis TaxID=301148 RepID=A0A150L6U2_9BACI|nr:hypothetical protein B4135_4160 [Caldibacillus debilis]